MIRERVVEFVAVLAAVFFVAFGLWSFFDPSSFFDEIATFEPYNEHLFHDVGAFQIGVGAPLLFAFIWRNDALLAALAGAGVGAIFHFVAHVGDTELGGRDTDPYGLGLLAAVIVGAAVWRWVSRSKTDGLSTDGGTD